MNIKIGNLYYLKNKTGPTYPMFKGPYDPDFGSERSEEYLLLKDTFLLLKYNIVSTRMETYILNYYDLLILINNKIRYITIPENEFNKFVYLEPINV